MAHFWLDIVIETILFQIYFEDIANISLYVTSNFITYITPCKWNFRRWSLLFREFFNIFGNFKTNGNKHMMGVFMPLRGNSKELAVNIFAPMSRTSHFFLIRFKKNSTQVESCIFLFSFSFFLQFNICLDS